jgi:hypothetical protein
MQCAQSVNRLHWGNMRAVSCIIVEAISLVFLWLANGEALAESNDPPTVKKTAKARKSATKPEKEKTGQDSVLDLEPDLAGRDAQFQHRPADQSQNTLHRRRRPLSIRNQPGEYTHQ